jgi:hypothetical protein
MTQDTRNMLCEGGKKTAMYNSLLKRFANYLPFYTVLIIISLFFSILFTYGWYINFTYAKPKVSEAIWGISERTPAGKVPDAAVSPAFVGQNENQNQTSAPVSAKKSGDFLMLIKYIFTVDLSTVTTLLLAISSICITAGFIRIYLLKKSIIPGKEGSLDRTSSEQWEKLRTSSFPFWSAYKHNFIYLGLLGTLFAFIIAFSQAQKEVTLLNTSAQSDEILKDMPAGDNSGPADILLFALGTALWSSFSAITLSLLPVNAFFRHFFIRHVVPENMIQSDEEIDTVLDRLTEKARQTEMSFAALAETSDSLSRNMNNTTVQNALTQLEFLQAEFKGLKNNFVSSAAFESRIKEITHTFQAPLTATQEELVTLKSDFMGLAGRLDALEKQSDEKTAINAHDIQKLRKDMEDLISRIKNLFN